MEQYRKCDSIKALYNLVLQYLLRNFDTLFMAFICPDALEQKTEICFWNRNVSSMWIPKSLTQSLVCTLHPFTSTIMCSGGRFKKTYELLNLRALKISPVNKIHIFQCMSKIFCVEFQRYPLKFHTKYLTHTLKDTIFIQHWNFKSS